MRPRRLTTLTMLATFVAAALLAPTAGKAEAAGDVTGRTGSGVGRSEPDRAALAGLRDVSTVH